MSSAARAKAMGGIRARKGNATRTREALPRGAGFIYGDVLPRMIGATRPPPRITVVRFDPLRLAMIQSVERGRAVEAIAAHLFLARDGRSLMQQYALGAKLDRSATPDMSVRA